MPYAYRDRPLNDYEFEELRLILSSFRDGTGQVVLKETGETMPGFRDYERALATVLNGSAPENKGVFDVIVPTEDMPFGISCKMTSMRPAHHGSSFMELSNSAAKFRARLLDHQINWVTEPMLAGPVIIDLVTEWHYALEDEIDIESSKYSVLSHNRRWTEFQLLSFPLDLRIANPRGDVDWAKEGASLNGYVYVSGRRHRLWECFLNSGGQLKYYPPFEWADWISEPFVLELPPPGSLRTRAQDYFGGSWPDAY